MLKMQLFFCKSHKGKFAYNISLSCNKNASYSLM